MQFWAGDAERIAAAMTSEDEDDYMNLEKAPWVHGFVDFSMHLVLENLDMLTTIAAGMVAAEAMKFSTEIERNLVSDSERPWLERGDSTDTLSTRWVALMASVPEARAYDVAAAWFRAFEAQEPPSIDAVHAVGGLTRLCRTALEKGVSVVFSFSA